MCIGRWRQRGRGDEEGLNRRDFASCPVIAKLEGDKDIVTLSDTRTEKGTNELFGGSNPAACLYVKQDFIEKSPSRLFRDRSDGRGRNEIGL